MNIKMVKNVITGFVLGTLLFAPIATADYNNEWGVYSCHYSVFEAIEGDLSERTFTLDYTVKDIAHTAQNGLNWLQEKSVKGGWVY